MHPKSLIKSSQKQENVHVGLFPISHHSHRANSRGLFFIELAYESMKKQHNFEAVDAENDSAMNSRNNYLVYAMKFDRFMSHSTEARRCGQQWYLGSHVQTKRYISLQ